MPTLKPDNHEVAAITEAFTEAGCLRLDLALPQAIDDFTNDGAWTAERTASYVTLAKRDHPEFWRPAPTEAEIAQANESAARQAEIAELEREAFTGKGNATLLANATTTLYALGCGLAWHERRLRDSILWGGRAEIHLPVIILTCPR